MLNATSDRCRFLLITDNSTLVEMQGSIPECRVREVNQSSVSAQLGRMCVRPDMILLGFADLSNPLLSQAKEHVSIQWTGIPVIAVTRLTVSNLMELNGRHFAAVLDMHAPLYPQLRLLTYSDGINLTSYGQYIASSDSLDINIRAAIAEAFRSPHPRTIGDLAGRMGVASSTVRRWYIPVRQSSGIRLSDVLSAVLTVRRLSGGSLGEVTTTCDSCRTWLRAAVVFRIAPPSYTGMSVL